MALSKLASKEKLRSLREQGEVPISSLSSRLINSASLLLLILVPGTMTSVGLTPEHLGTITRIVMWSVFSSALVWASIHIMSSVFQTWGYFAVHSIPRLRDALRGRLEWTVMIYSSLVVTGIVFYVFNGFLRSAASILSFPSSEKLSASIKLLLNLKLVLALSILSIGVVGMLFTRMYFRWIHREKRDKTAFR